MKNVGDLMQRLQKMMPAHIKPAFKTGEELLAWQKNKERSAPPLSNVKIGR
ncbi:DNA replication protein [Escherichia coli]|nr:DNA replication protein [Escherichia coli]